MLKYNSAVFWRLGTKSSLRSYAQSTITILKTEKVDVANNVTNKTPASKSENESSDNGKSGLLASAFASLNDPNPLPERKPSLKSIKLSHLQKIDQLIKEANDVNSVLSIAEAPVVSRRHALKIVSILSEWSSLKKVKLVDFEKDPRFLRLCRILARTQISDTAGYMTRPDDLGTVLGITGDDEAARLINNLTLPQMVKVMQALANKGRRSTPLLRALSNNIADIAEPIDLKKSADLLFCMSSLNFPDPILMDRICNDTINQLKENTSNIDKTSVVTSIVTSLGLIRYRHEPALSVTCDWIVNNKAKCRPQDLASTIVTLATLNFVPPSAEDLLQSAVNMKESDLVKTSSYLDLVFSLLILQKATLEQLQSTLRADFIEKLLAVGEIPITVRRKLMAIDAYISLSQPKYNGPRLPEDIAVGVPVVYTKEKQLYVQSIMDTFKNLISSGNFLKKDCNSGMGFLYDGEFIVDSKCHPLPLSQAGKDKNVFHIAILGLDYHDLCRKTPEPLGVYKLYTNLLELKGFKVLQIPYSEFNPRDKLITRVQYIERRLKEIVGLK